MQNFQLPHRKFAVETTGDCLCGSHVQNWRSENEYWLCESQHAVLRAAGCVKIYSEKESGAKTDRAALQKLLKRLDKGDVLIVTRLDRLARSTRDLLNTLDVISKAGAKFRSLNDPWADTCTPHGELMVTILAGLATFERHLILARTAEGRQRAKARGAHMGRPSKLTLYQRREAISRREAGEPLMEIARTPSASATRRFRAWNPYMSPRWVRTTLVSVSARIESRGLG